MKNTIRILFIIAALMVSVGVFAQTDYGPDYLDYGGSSGGGGGYCFLCAYSSGYANQARCVGYAQDQVGMDPSGAFQGYSGCVEHNAQVGPATCDLTGWCHGNYYASTRDGRPSPLSANAQCNAIAAYLRQSGIITAEAVDDFVAKTDYDLQEETWADAQTKRLASYRAKFAELMRRELKPGAIPVMPHKPTKAPATVTASN